MTSSSLAALLVLALLSLSTVVDVGEAFGVSTRRTLPPPLVGVTVPPRGIVGGAADAASSSVAAIPSLLSPSRRRADRPSVVAVAMGYLDDISTGGNDGGSSSSAAPSSGSSPAAAGSSSSYLDDLSSSSPPSQSEKRTAPASYLESMTAAPAPATPPAAELAAQLYQEITAAQPAASAAPAATEEESAAPMASEPDVAAAVPPASYAPPASEGKSPSSLKDRSVVQEKLSSFSSYLDIVSSTPPLTKKPGESSAVKGAAKDPPSFSSTTSSIPKTRAIVPVNEGTVEFTSGLIGGVVGLAVAGPVAAVVAAAAANYASRSDEDVGDIVRAVSKSAIQVYNYLSFLDGKYRTLEKARDSLKRTYEQAKVDPGANPTLLRNIEEALDRVNRRLKELNDNYDLVDGGFVILGVAGDLVEIALNKIDSLSKQYKLTDRAWTTVKQKNPDDTK